MTSEPAIGVAECDRCPHARHLGECGQPTEREHVSFDCSCVRMPASDLPRLRREVAAQERRVAEMASRKPRPWAERDYVGDFPARVPDPLLLAPERFDPDRDEAGYDEERLPWEQAGD